MFKQQHKRYNSLKYDLLLTVISYKLRLQNTIVRKKIFEKKTL